MAYIRICDACKKPISEDNYISILVETPQDRCCVIAFHDAKKYDICPSCYSVITQNIIPSINETKRNEEIAWEFVRR